jgi:hypothetical protein
MGTVSPVAQFGTATELSPEDGQASIANSSCEFGQYKSCTAHGDPRLTRNFLNASLASLRSGVYQLASTISGCFDMQGFQCTVDTVSFGASVFAGFALKIGTTRVTIIKKALSVNGSIVSQDYSSDSNFSFADFAQSLFHANGCNSCVRLAQYTTMFSGPFSSVLPGYFQSVNIDIGIEDAKLDGLCGGSASDPVNQGDVLFSEMELAGLNSICQKDPAASFDAADTARSATESDVLRNTSMFLDDWTRDTNECKLQGTPRVINFDRGIVPLDLKTEVARSDLLSPGKAAKWLVRSESVRIQAHYNTTDGFLRLPYVKSLVLSGAFLQSNVLSIHVEPQRITWNNVSILEDSPSQFVIPGLIEARRQGFLPQVQDRSQMRQGVEFALPLSVRLLVSRLPKHLNFALRMEPTPGQDGLCGNFNGAQNDDALNVLTDRDALNVDASEFLF